MTLRSLGDGLRDLADAVEPADMRDRALAASRRLRARRVAGGMVATVVGLLALVLGINSVLPGLPPSPRDLAGDAGASDSASALSVVPEQAFSLTGGSFYYLSGADATDTQQVVRWSSGSKAEVVARGLPATGTEQLSPDGRYLSSVEGGELRVRELATGDQRGLLSVADDQRCNIPTWTPRGDRLVVQTGPSGSTGPLGFVDVESGVFAEFAEFGGGCSTFASYNPSGSVDLTFTTYGQDAQAVARSTLEGAVISSQDWNALGGDYLDQVASVSPDGSLVCVGVVPHGTAPGDITTPHARSCQAVGLWADGFQWVEVGEEFEEAVVLQDAFITRSATNAGGATLRLHDAGGTELESVVEPELPQGSQFLGFVPSS